MKLRDILFETPDSILYKSTYVSCDSEINYAFGYYNNIMYLGNKAEYHSEMTIPDVYVHRDIFTFPGRLWPTEKIISFWQFPTEKKLQQIIKDLNILIKEKNFYLENRYYKLSWI